MKKYNTNAIVLKSINYKDKDKIYTLFTEHHGKISALGRGVRKISSRRGGNLDSLNYISIKITERDGGFRDIDEVITLDSFKSIKSDYETSLKAYYLADLIHRNMEENADDPQVFKLFKKVLEILDKKQLNVDLAILFFEVQFLKHFGYFPELPVDSDIAEVIKKLLKGIFKDIEPNPLVKTKMFIQDHIKLHLNERFKSLDL